MRYKELALLKAEELDAKIKELRRELMKQYSQVAAGTMPKNPGQIKVARKTIAQILTIKNSQKNKKEVNH